MEVRVPVGLVVHCDGNVVVDDHVDLLHVYAPGTQVGGDQHFLLAVTKPETVEADAQVEVLNWPGFEASQKEDLPRIWDFSCG